MAGLKWRLAQGKTWKQKLEQEHPNHGKVVAVPARWQKRFGRGTMLIPRPLDVDAVMRKVKKGELATQSRVRERLARDAEVDHACPLTTGIFFRMVAEAAEEARRAGKQRVTPYWRTIKDGGELNANYPGGTRAQAAKLRREGFTIQAGKGKRAPTVKAFEKYLVEL